jgi:hypothetical protein
VDIHARALARVVGVALFLFGTVTIAACSGNGSGPSVTLPPRESSVTTTTRPPISPPSVTERPDLTTTSRPPLTTAPTTEAPTTSSGAPTIPTSTSAPTTTAVSTTTALSTTTSSTAVTTTTSGSTSISSTSTVSTTVTTAAPATDAPTSTEAAAPALAESTSTGSAWPWVIVVIVVVAAALLGWLLLRRRSGRRSWWDRADGLVREARAVVDLGSTGPASSDPEHQVARWSTLEQRTQTLIADLNAAVDDAPNEEARGTVVSVSMAAQAFLTEVQRTRALHLGPPGPSAEQLEFAAAESNQRVAELGRAADQLEQLAHEAVSR